MRFGKGPSAVELLTNNVSFRGVFLRTDTPPALRQLVKLELHLPDKTIVTAHAMVVHVAKRPEGEAKGEGAVPGVGLQFWGPIDKNREWDRFINELRQKEKAGTSTAKAADKVRRASVRIRLALEVVIDGSTVMTRDVSENGMAIRTTVPMPVGSMTQVQLRAGTTSLLFDAIVRRTINEPNFQGLGVELVNLAPDRRAELVRFIRTNAPNEDRIFIPPGDPKLH